MMSYMLKELKAEGVSRDIVVAKIHKPKKLKKEIIYPESDGKRMADNTKQFGWIVTIKEGLEVLFADNPDVFVAGDFLWYPVEGNNKIRIGPDAMVVFGRPKGHRGSYLQWKEKNIPPQVVFEVLSPGNTKSEMDNKLKFYERYGVEEYYIYDPDDITIKGFIRKGDKLVEIDKMKGWISLKLKIRFEIIDNELNIFRPDGKKFLTFLETEAKAKEAEIKAKEAEVKVKEAETKAKEAEVKAKESEVKVKEAETKAKEAEVKAKESEVKVKEAETKAKEAEVKAKESEAKAKEAEVKAKESEVKAKEALEIAEQERKIADYEREKVKILEEKLKTLSIQ